ncbi:MAG TPA: tyrosine-type recombinase/integrase [Chitinispirillaceae bacterium]|nr:tyrosine-type recombinase/integrase [Chitinispirillaceae bacterium]
MQSYLHLILSIPMQHRLFFHGGGFGGKSRGRFTDPDENRQITSASLFTADIRSIINAPVNFKHRLILILVYGCGLRLGEQGVDLRYIQVLLGHVSSTTTEIYTHVAAHKIVTIKSPVAGLSSQSG